MLKELKKYENLGTPKYFWELFQILQKGEIWKLSDIKSHFYNRIIDDRQIFDGCIPLLELSNIILIKEETEEVVVQYGFRNFYSERMCSNKILEGVLQKLKEDKNFNLIFKQSHFDYLHTKAIVIDNSAFGLQYVNIKKLLLDFGFLLPHPQFERKLIINSRWKKFFDSEITPKVRKVLSLEELKEQIQKQEQGGKEAEKFVLEFERNRLNEKENIEWISPYDSNAGFDILSFHNTDDMQNNRFIEVKSYSGEKPHFYWTSNEINKAKELMGDYVIYLVNRDEISNEDYEPEMFFNPIESILNNNRWIKEVDKYHLLKNKYK